MLRAFFDLSLGPSNPRPLGPYLFYSVSTGFLTVGDRKSK